MSEDRKISEMVERVARAIRFKDYGDTDAWDAQPTAEHDHYRRLARAAIAAMREPTEGMLLAGERAEELGDTAPYKHWQAMIDEALR